MTVKNERNKHILVSAFLIVLFPILKILVDSIDEYELKILSYLLCWCGVLCLVHYMRLWKKVTGGWFSMQFLFIAFCCLFNYGQCMMWAFGVHTSRELSIGSLLYSRTIIGAHELCMTQLFTVIVLYLVNTGLLITYKEKYVDYKKIQQQNSGFLNANILAAAIIVPVTFYCTIRTYISARAYGYLALYYGDNAYSTNSVLTLISMMSFTNSMGLLIGNTENKKSINYFVYGTTLLLYLLNFAAGDRGFVYHAMILLFWYMQRRKDRRIRIRKVIPYAIVGYVLLGFLTAVQQARRSVGFSFSDLLSVFLSANSSPVVEAFFEMGGSMAPLLILVQYGSNPYPYGNTFIFALLGMISERFISLLGLPYQSLSNYFSFTFLRLNYGAGFSFVAELYMNFGFYVGLVFALILGLLIGRLLCINIKGKMGELFEIATISNLIYIARNTFQNGTKHFFYGVIAYMIIVWAISSLMNRTSRV